MKLTRVRRALTESAARTRPDARDPSLRGRTYAIAFDRVWNVALEIARGGLRGWEAVRWDDEAGVIEAQATTLVFRFVDDVVIRIGLDANAQTRVDVESSSRRGKADLGTNRRRIGKFLKALDRGLAAGPRQILDSDRSLEPVG